MPLVVHVYYNSKRYFLYSDNGRLLPLGSALAQAIANHLTCDDEGGELTQSKVKVMFHEYSRCDTRSFDFVFEIKAMYFSARQANLQERVLALRDSIRGILPGMLSFGLWVKLNSAGWYADTNSAWSDSR